MHNLTVSRLISDHMVLQHGKPVHLWGKGQPGRQVRARLCAERDGHQGVSPASASPLTTQKAAEAEAAAQISANGDWSLFLPALRSGRTVYTLIITDDGGARIEIFDVLIGEVWFASGQSNMDLTMERVRDRYPEEIRDCGNPYIRTFKLAEHTDYHGPLAQPLSGEWRSASKETILDFSATGYFFAKHLFQATGIPVGFLHASLGGSRISGWMGREMLAASTDAAPEGYPALLAEAERYADDEFLAGQIRKNEDNAAAWNAELARREENCAQASLSAGTISVPGFFRDVTELSGFIGKISLTKHFVVTEEMLRAAKEAQTNAASAAETSVGRFGRIRLFLGTMVDRDETLINGVRVGETGYQYPPRKYDVPWELLRAGENEIQIRLVVEYGEGRLTPGKKYSILCEKENGKTRRDTGGHPVGAEGGQSANVLWEVDLSGEWQYQVLAAMDAPMPATDFVNWHPTGLYNGMAAPCHPCTIGGFLWYQGEADTHLPGDYEDLQRRLMRGWRRAWREESEQKESGQERQAAADAEQPAVRAEESVPAGRRETLPFLYVQLPNFRVDLDETGLTQWADLREKQRRCLAEPLSGMIETGGLGDDNDLHPHEKEEIGRRLAALALELKRETL